MSNVNITLQQLWGVGYLPWIAGKYPWQLISEIGHASSVFSGFQTLWSDDYFPWLNESFPWEPLGIIAGTGLTLTPSAISSATTPSADTITVGTGVTNSLSALQIIPTIQDPTLKTDAHISLSAISAQGYVPFPDNIGGNIWDDIEGNTDSWTQINKPGSPSYQESNKPTDIWTNI